VTRILAAATERVDLFRKLLDVGFLDRERGHEDLLARRNLRLVAIENFRHQLHRAIAKLKWLLHDRGIDRAVFNTIQGFVFSSKATIFTLSTLFASLTAAGSPGPL
jgi:hypothetical protein